MRTIEWDDDRDCVRMVDQTKLPSEYTTYHAETVDELVESIRVLRVRGAPALGAAGAFGVALAARRREADSLEAFKSAVRTDAERIAGARPTAVNLSEEVGNVVPEVESATGVETMTEFDFGHSNTETVRKEGEVVSRAG